jgi:tetratricopeptide (TPR) repeat protein
MPYDCFISYASADLPYAEELNRRLTSEGLTVWFDKARLSPGCDWHREIEQGCENSRIMLPILTPRWKESEWTRFETYGAEAVIPLVYEGKWADVATPPLELIQAEQVNAASLNKADWARLCTNLRHLLGRATPQKQDRLVHLQYRANDHFVGRDHDLIRIHEELHRNPRTVLTQGRVRAITAMGGVGKTTLARQYAEKFWRCYPQIFWVDARKGLETEFAVIHDLIFPDRRDIGLKAEDKAKQALHKLSYPTTCLLIIDNAEDEQATTEWIPKTGGCHTLITSRFAGWSEAVKTLHLFVLDKGPAVEFLERRTEHKALGQERANCYALTEKLGYLPLALEQAAAYIKKLSLTFSEYLRIYDTATRDLLALRALGSTEYPDSVITSLQPSLEKIGPGARAILRLASMVATTPISWLLFAAKPDLTLRQVGSLTVPKPVTPPANFEFWMMNEIASLVDYSLVEFDGQNISLHPLLLTVQYETQSMPERRENWSAVAQLMVAASPAPTWKIDCREFWTLENDQKWERLVPQIDRLLELEGRIPDVPLDPSFEILAINTFAAQGNYSRAISLSRLLCQRLTASADADAVLIEARDCLASLLKQSDQLQEALDEFRSLSTLLAKVRGEDHPSTLRALHNAACLMELLDDTPGAESLMRDVLERRKRLMGENHYETTISVHDLGWLLNNHPERLGEAEPLLRQALEQWKKTLGVANPDSRDAASNLARLLRNKGDFEDHIDCYGLRHNLALFQFSAGYDQQALGTIEEVIAGYRRYLPPNHRDMLTALQDLGTILARLKRLSEAVPLLNEALAGYESTQEPDSEDTLRTVGNLAQTLDLLGRSDEARPLKQRQLRAISAKKDASPAECRVASFICMETGDYDLAESFMKRALAANFEVPSSHCHLARIYLLTGRDVEAREEIARAWELRDGIQPFYVLPRILFLRLLVCLLDRCDPKVILGQLKGAFADDKAHMHWKIQMLTDHLKPRLNEANVALLEAASAAIDDKANIPRLDEFSQWIDAPALTVS